MNSSARSILSLRVKPPFTTDPIIIGATIKLSFKLISKLASMFFKKYSSLISIKPLLSAVLDYS